MAPLRVISAIHIHTREPAAVHPASPGLVSDEEFVAGFMTADFAREAADGRKRSPAHLALLKDIEVKIDELKTVEKRLGSPSELPADMDQARELAHRINNLLTTYRLGGDPSEGGSDI
jgi:hypothetical protein